VAATSSRRKTSARSRKSQLLRTFPGQNSKKMLCWTCTSSAQCACANILLTPVFCRRQYLVNAYILSTPIFCRPQYFVDAYFLSTPFFCRRLTVVDASILLTQIFNDVWRIVLSYVNIFIRNMCLAIMAPVRQFIRVT
jgi:hypothetical protein